MTSSGESDQSNRENCKPRTKIYGNGRWFILVWERFVCHTAPIDETVITTMVSPLLSVPCVFLLVSLQIIIQPRQHDPVVPIVSFVSADDIYQNYQQNKNKKKKIAIIGGGISGTFLTKYLVDYDSNCTTFDTITIFEPNLVTGTIRKDHQNKSNHQSSRIASYEMEIDIDTSAAGTKKNNESATSVQKIVIELGASILHKGFHLVMQMIHNDPNLRMGLPYTTGNEDIDHQILDPSSMGIYNGNGSWPILFTSSTIPQHLRKYYLLLRYHWDLITVSKLCQQVNKRYNIIPHLLDVSNDYFMDSPREIWTKALLYDTFVTKSFDSYLDTQGVSSYSLTKTNMWKTVYRSLRNTISSVWYNWIPHQGSIRSELLAAINIVNYNQNNTQVNAVTGFGSFAAASGDDIFSIQGGNYQIITSAYQQSIQNRNQFCSAAADEVTSDGTVPSSTLSTVQLIAKRISTVVGDLHGLALFAEENEFVGEYDIVILAVPLQQSQINFLIQSTMDPSIVQDMPLGGRVNAHKIIDNIEDHDGHVQLPHPVPDSAVRPYTQVVTTIVRDVTDLNFTFFDLKDASQLPRGILMTSSGQLTTYNITAITLITRGIYKVFSNQPLEPEIIEQIFGTSATIEYEQVWGGLHGGATPDYQADKGSNTTNFLLYDGAHGLHGHTKSGALYYTNTMEQTALSCMEISAIGAKAVAKLVAERVGLLEERPCICTEQGCCNSHDEL